MKTLVFLLIYVILTSTAYAFKKYFSQYHYTLKHDNRYVQKIQLQMGMFDGLRKMVGVVDQSVVLA